MEDKTIGTVIKELFQDLYIKWALRIIFIGLGICLIWGWIDYRHDVDSHRHAKFLWWERNIPQGYPDTVWVKTQAHDSILVSKQKITYTPKYNKAFVKKNELAQSNTNGDNKANINNGTNNGIIGDNGTINGPIQPHPEQFHIDYIKQNYPDKNTTIRFAYSSNSRMSQVFTGELIEKLENEGYSDVGSLIDLSNNLQNEVKRGIVPMKDKPTPGPKTVPGHPGIMFFIKVED